VCVSSFDRFTLESWTFLKTLVPNSQSQSCGTGGHMGDTSAEQVAVETPEERERERAFVYL